MAMISSPKRVGLRTSTAASRTTSRTLRPVLSSSTRRAAFSTMMTELSTTSPKSMAPRLIRVPATPKRSIMSKAKSIDSGMARATMSPALRLPRNAKSTAMTSSAPSSRLLCTVCST